MADRGFRVKDAVITNFYDVLEVSPRASAEVIQAAYRTLMKRFHPDVGGNARTAQLLNEAYETLSDSTKRTRYDREKNALPGKIVGNFRVLERIAEGGFGTTYRGEHTLVKELVCIKHCLNISPQDEEILIQEAQAIWDLRHFAIPAVRDVLRLSDGSLALVMSYVSGPTLQQLVEKMKTDRDKLDAETVAWITERILNALMYLHMNGVVHGDIKPANVIIQPKDHMVVLVDYGLSMVKPSRGSNSKGYTPLFAPPEELAGKPLLPESDFYSLGMTMIYALSGDIRNVSGKQVPENTPEVMCDFIRQLIARDVLARPNWEKENVFEAFQKVRLKAFGRARSGLKPIPGF